MKLSDGEKLIIFMLADIYKKTGMSGEIDPKFVTKAIAYNQEWSLSWKYSGLNFEDTPTPPHVKDVTDYLDMWDFLETSYDALDAADKKRVETEAEPYGKEVKFAGFDGNNESEHMGAAQFLIEDMGKWSRFAGRGLNSHYPTLAVYERMYEVFEPIRAKSWGAPLSADDIIAVLTARRHPSHR